jgi:hypothetical protein
MVPYIQFQTTLGFLKAPTDEYLLPGVDILGGIAIIREKVVNGSYANQYEFITEFKSIVSRPRFVATM